MLKRTAAVAFAAAAIVLNAPAAYADAPVRTCRFHAASQDGVNFEGVAAGTITHAGGGIVSVQCYLKVNGDPVAFTPTGTGEATAATVGQIFFQAGGTDYVEICTLGQTVHGPVDECFETTAQEDPTPGIVPSLICEVTAEIGKRGLNVLGQLIVHPDGDVELLGSTILDCPLNYEGQPVTVRFG